MQGLKSTNFSRSKTKQDIGAFCIALNFALEGFAIKVMFPWKIILYLHFKCRTFHIFHISLLVIDDPFTDFGIHIINLKATVVRRVDSAIR